MKRKVLYLAVIVALLSGCGVKPDMSEQPIQAFNIDFNDAPGGAHGFAKPGTWAADANPEKQFKWYQDLGCNIILSFAVASNGWAWYKNGIIPEQPGLKTDFLTEMVKLGHKNNIKVFGYFCLGANNKWEIDHPDMCYHMDGVQIPLTNQYLDYFCASIEDAIKKTDIDGIGLDWFYNPGGTRWMVRDKDPLPDIKWLPCEQEMYKELMNEPFPGKDKVTEANAWIYMHKAIDRAWIRVRDITKKTKPDCIIFLSCYNVLAKEIANSDMLKQTDWLMNEAGDTVSTEAIRKSIGKHTRLMTCLANWNKQDPTKIVEYAKRKHVGLYGFTMSIPETYDRIYSYVPSPVDSFLTRPIDDFKGDNRNIATFARVYHNLPLSYIKK